MLLNVGSQLTSYGLISLVYNVVPKFTPRGLCIWKIPRRSPIQILTLPKLLNFSDWMRAGHSTTQVTSYCCLSLVYNVVPKFTNSGLCIWKITHRIKHIFTWYKQGLIKHIIYNKNQLRSGKKSMFEIESGLIKFSFE